VTDKKQSLSSIVKLSVKRPINAVIINTHFFLNTQWAIVVNDDQQDATIFGLFIYS